MDVTKFTKKDYDLFMKKILYKSSFLLKSNRDGKVVFYILNDENKNENCNKVVLNRKLKEEGKILEYNFKKFLEFLHIVKEKIEAEITYKYNLIIKLDFYIDESHSNKDSYIYNMICKYYFYPPNQERLSSFQDENVLINGIDGIHQGFYFLISEINDENYKDYSYDNNLDILALMTEKEKYEEELKTIKAETIKQKKTFSLTEIIKSDIVSEFQIIKIKSLIGNHTDSAEFIQTLNNGYYISGGNGRTLYIYNQKYIKKIDINLSIHPIGICQIKNQENDSSMVIVAFSNENINIITLEPNNNSFIVQNYKNYASNILEINHNKYIIICIKGVYIVDNLITPLDNYENRKLLRYSYRAAIRISKKLIVLTSNNILSNGKNRLVIYDINAEDVFYELEGYSFSLCLNSFLLMDNDESNKDQKILLCACKKYTSYNNNGILLLSIKIDDNDDINTKFFITGNFEPYCFCRILLINNSKENIENCKKEYNTDYFLVGGFDNESNKGIIKLFKIIFDYHSYNIIIEYKQDIIFSNDYDCKGAVTCITQSRNDGNFLISYSNGNAYLCSPANINYFLLCDENEKEKEKKQLSYEDSLIYATTTLDNNEKTDYNLIKYNNEQIFQCVVKNVFKNKMPFELDFFQSK